jgi:arginine repressor
VLRYAQYAAMLRYCDSIPNDGNMKYPIRNFVYEKIQESENLTDSELLNSLAKAGVNLSEANLAKTLIDLEIYGLIRVFWISKEKKRIELRSNTTG